MHDNASAEAYCTLGGQHVIPPKVAWSIGESCSLKKWAVLVTGGAATLTLAPSGSSMKSATVDEGRRSELLKILLGVYMHAGFVYHIRVPRPGGPD